MADELHTPNHRWYEPRNHIALAKEDVSKQWIFDSGIQKIDAWINSQPWGDPLSPIIAALLFSNNEPGFLTPISPSVCFTDTAGTTQAQVGQAVALALDSSRGLKLGPELVTNGTFDVDLTGWTVGPGLSATAVGGRVEVSRSGGITANNAFKTFVPTVAGRFYRIGIDVIQNSGFARNYTNSVGSSLAGFVAASIPGSGRYEVVVQAVDSQIGLNYWCDDLSTTILDNISVRELPGVHWTQPTLANRPILGRKPKGGRRNLLTFTEQFDNAAWNKSGVTVTANAAVAPDGTATANRLVEASTNEAHFINQPLPPVTDIGVVGSVFARADTRDHITLHFSGSAARATASFNLSAGTVRATRVTGGFTGGTATITDVGGGWFRCSFAVGGIAIANTAQPQIQIDDGVTALSDNGVSYLGDGISGIFIWGAQLELGSTATDYQRVTTRFDVTEVGKADYHYLFCGGSADPRWMQTPTITPGTDKAQVFAGVRKLSDVGYPLLVELSATANSNNGSFNIIASGAVVDSAGWNWTSRGTTAIQAQVGAGFPAPITNVLTGIGDISGDLATLRVNGTQVAQSTADQGTGNFLAYPAYIGARAGTSLYFNGEIYALGVRFGPNLDTATIEKVEQYVASLVAEPTI
jgi:hypothetical protein